MSDTPRRGLKLALGLISYISLMFWIICEDMPLDVQLLAFGAMNLLFFRVVEDDTPKEKSG